MDAAQLPCPLPAPPPRGGGSSAWRLAARPSTGDARRRRGTTTTRPRKVVNRRRGRNWSGRRKACLSFEIQHLSIMLATKYRVSQKVSDWVRLTLIWMFHSSCPTALPSLPISHQPKQNWADNGTAKISQPNPGQRPVWTPCRLVI